MEDNKNRDGFKTNLGTILALAGSAVGLGNIWRFPYMVVENGGAAFILIYIVLMFLICIPAFMSEFAIGRNTKKNVFGAFKTLAPKTRWYQIGLLGILSTFVISSFYSVIGGWTLAFLYDSVVNTFKGMSPDEVSSFFDGFVNTPLSTSLWALGFILLSTLILISGVGKGIERYNKILMPMLLGILALMAINSFFLDNYMEGIRYMFYPDFSKITFKVVLSALGQAFFSMSLGLGTIITYGSYARKQDNALKSSFSVAVIGITVALLSGLVIFPAVFSFHISAGSGSNLAFVAFPAIFQEMPGGYFFGIIFFLLLLVAAMTSVISLFEVIVAFLSEEYKIKRYWATLCVIVSVAFSSAICACSLTEGSSLKIAGKTVFDFFDYVSASYMLPLGGLLVAIFTAWIWDKKKLYAELSSDGLYRASYFSLYLFIVRYLIPIFIVFIFLSQIGIF